MYSGLIDTGVHLIAGVIGGGFLWHARAVFRQRTELTDADADHVSAVTDGASVALDGTVQAAKNESGGITTVTSPLSNTHCVLGVWCVEEFIGHELGPESRWTEKARGYVTTPFELTDGSGTITIDIQADHGVLETEFDLKGLDAPYQQVTVDDELPESIQQFEATYDVPERTPADPRPPSSDDGPTQGDRRYYEATVATGDALFVFETAHARDSQDEYCVSDSIGESLLISDTGRDGAADERAERAGVVALVAVVLLWYAFHPLL